MEVPENEWGGENTRPIHFRDLLLSQGFNPGTKATYRGGHLAASVLSKLEMTGMFRQCPLTGLSRFSNIAG